jgi:hypothetical protein
VVAVVQNSVGRANCSDRIESLPYRFVADGVHMNLKSGAIESDGDLLQAFRRPIQNASFLAVLIGLQQRRRATSPGFAMV